MLHFDMEITTTLLILNVIFLAVLVPGGPIENRDFSHLPRKVFWGFNAFLVSLILVAITTVYFSVQNAVWYRQASFVVGLAFFAVYALDLAKIFPKSPTPMSKALKYVEIVNAGLAILLISSTVLLA